MKIVTTLPGSIVSIARNQTTGIIHQFGGSISRCGLSKKNIILLLSEAENANPQRFCEKCFPNGKPAEFFENIV